MAKKFKPGVSSLFPNLYKTFTFEYFSVCAVSFRRASTPPRGCPPAPPPPNHPGTWIQLYMITMEKGTNSGRFQTDYAILWTKLAINVNCPKFGAISSFHNVYTLALPFANQLFPSVRQLRKTKLWSRPVGMKSTEIIRDVKKSMVCVTRERSFLRFGKYFQKSSPSRPENISLTVGTDRSPPSYTMY